MTEYEGLKVAELKDELRERNLTVSGKKAELIARLQEYDEQQKEGAQPDQAETSPAEPEAAEPAGKEQPAADAEPAVAAAEEAAADAEAAASKAEQVAEKLEATLEKVQEPASSGRVALQQLPESEMEVPAIPAAEPTAAAAAQEPASATDVSAKRPREESIAEKVPKTPGLNVFPEATAARALDDAAAAAAAAEPDAKRLKADPIVAPALAGQSPKIEPASAAPADMAASLTDTVAPTIVTPKSSAVHASTAPADATVAPTTVDEPAPAVTAPAAVPMETEAVPEHDDGVTLADRGGYREPSAADLVEDVTDDPQTAAAPIDDPVALVAAPIAADALLTSADLPALIPDAAAAAEALSNQADVAAGAEQGMPAAQAIDSMGTVVSAVLAPVEPAAAALQTEALVELVDYGAEPLAEEAAPAAAAADTLAAMAAPERTDVKTRRRNGEDKSRSDRKRDRSETGAVHGEGSKVAKRTDHSHRDESGSRRRDPIKFEAGDKGKPSEHSERRKAADTKFSDAPDGTSKEAKRPSVFERLQSKSSGGTRSLAARQASSKVTRAMRIDGFVRPFPEKAARDLISETGGDLESFWMPTIKSTAWVVFASEEQAEATFQAVWGKEWPPGNRSRLNPQYVPVDEAFSKAGLGDGPGVRRQVSGAAADPAANGNAPSAPANQTTSVPDGDARRREGHRSSGAGRHAAEAADEAAATAAKAAAKQEPRGDQRRATERDQGRRGSGTKLASVTPPEEAVPTLDTLFKKTTTQPKLYWLPLTEAQAAAGVAKQAAEAGTQLQAGNGPAISAK